MNDFTKQKVAFAVGLLAVLFTITPLLQPFGHIGYPLFGVQLTFLRLYYALSIVLALAVYAYAIQFLTDRDLRYPSKVGDFFYAIAIVTPACYLVLFGLVRLAAALSPLLSEPIIRRLQDAVGIVVGILAYFALQWLLRVITRRTEKLFVLQLLEEEAEHTQRADTLFEAGDLNSAVLEIWQAVEAASRRFLLQRHSRAPFWQWGVWRRIQHSGMFAFEHIEAFNALRRLRNSAANITSTISREQAEAALSIARNILRSLAGPNRNADAA